MQQPNLPFFFFFNDTATTEIYTLSLHDALPICPARPVVDRTVVLIGGYILLSPNIFPWYVLWLVPFLAVRPSPPWIAFTGTVAFAYTFFLGHPWAIPAWARVV